MCPTLAFDGMLERPSSQWWGAWKFFQSGMVAQTQLGTGVVLVTGLSIVQYFSVVLLLMISSWLGGGGG
jgi:hypothetical protein